MGKVPAQHVNLVVMTIFMKLFVSTRAKLANSFCHYSTRVAFKRAFLLKAFVEGKILFDLFCTERFHFQYILLVRFLVRFMYLTA